MARHLSVGLEPLDERLVIVLHLARVKIFGRRLPVTTKRRESHVRRS